MHMPHFCSSCVAAYDVAIPAAPRVIGMSQIQTVTEDKHTFPQQEIEPLERLTTTNHIFPPEDHLSCEPLSAKLSRAMDSCSVASTDIPLANSSDETRVA